MNHKEPQTPPESQESASSDESSPVVENQTPQQAQEAPSNPSQDRPEVLPVIVSPDFSAETQPSPPADEPAPESQEPILPKLYQTFRTFLERYGGKIWWLHSIYALGIGIFVVLFARKGFEHTRWLVVSLSAGWLILILFFRLYGTGHAQKDKITNTKEKIRFYVMTYVLKNLYQGMLFFVLPFYWYSSTWGASTQWFVLGLAMLALLSTLDVVFDQVMMRWKIAASAMYLIVLFACLNLVIPALFPNTRTLLSLILAAAISAIVFWSMHVPLRALKRPSFVMLFMLSMAAAVSLAYFGRRAIPPVPMHVSTGAVGPTLLPDGRLKMHVSTLHESMIQEMHVLTDVVVPGGHKDRMFHIWRHEGIPVQRSPVESTGNPPKGIVRLRSTLKSENLVDPIAGEWSVDVVTEDEQLVGRVTFTVIQ